MNFAQFTRPALPFRIAADFSQPELPRADLTDTKLGGAPYRPVGAQWPTNMYLLAQLNLSELPQVLDLPTTGLLQIFLPFAEGYGSYGPPFCHIDYWPTCDNPAEPLLFDGTTFRPEDVQPERYPMRHGESGIAFTLEKCALLNPCFGLRLTPGQVIQQLPQLNEDIDSNVPGRAEILEYLEDAAREEYLAIHAQSAQGGVQMGGFANLVQTDFDAPAEEELLLFQIDYDPNVMWLGDCGSLQIFIKPAALSARNFAAARTYFSCS
ncbi:YwqG family protein [Staphylococcus chromogenes]|nr:YwqG family protein [Staphylococcus chromogenes]